ncbi:hypothetical protein J7E81_07055 [Bacillus sp. ISL-18]|uniref:hypothetical protein n=1 Tax=Bacillus sp. ISL-18 TaxID=2819118 RepID=UPI001BE61519|nr:hypothetical protein [Bacillus sp. ISL-18]MBT2655011.1 hypothetical protein [Bacillus sp. ISL-18]
MLEGTFLLLLTRTHLVVFAVPLFCLVAFVSGFGNACFDTVLMKEIPEEHQGMMFGLFATIGNTILGLSMLLAGVALNYLSPRFLGLNWWDCVYTDCNCYSGCDFNESLSEEQPVS